MEQKKIALITGVSRKMGLGYETAKQLIAAGYEVVITARIFETVNSLAEKIGAKAAPLDISSDASVNALAEHVKQNYGRLDVLINNAGGHYDQGGSALAAKMDFVKAAFETNLLGAWRMIIAFLPLLKAAEYANIVNVSSGAGSFSDEVFGLAYNQGGVPVYGITKLALNGLTVKVDRELNGSSVKVNSVCPGFTATYPGTEQWGARPVQDGAAGIVWAATLPADGPSGKFFRDKEEIAW